MRESRQLPGFLFYKNHYFTILFSAKIFTCLWYILQYLETLEHYNKVTRLPNVDRILLLRDRKNRNLNKYEISYSENLSLNSLFAYHRPAFTQSDAFTRHVRSSAPLAQSVLADEISL